MHVYYRISDSSYEKKKLPGIGKQECLRNFLKVWAEEANSVEIIADRCKPSTIDWLCSETLFPLRQTDLGNAGSLRYTLELAMSLPSDETVYVCEDDYLHQSWAPQLTAEIQDKTDYFTLYDHPDKYTSDYQLGETSKVIRTQSSHWRFSQSTTMTFGCKVGVLKEDWSVWDKYTQGTHPHDHFIFTDLNKKGRFLAVAIPGVACHTDLTFSNSKGGNLVEPWAMRMAIDVIEKRLGIYTSNPLPGGNPDTGQGLWNRLMWLQVCVNQKTT